MLKAILIDDDFRDREVLEQLLEKYCSGDIIITGNASNIEDAYKLILETRPHLIFLDVELGNETGFDLLSRFSEFNFKIVFVTAYDRYAVQAIKFNALDYVLKPVEISALVQVVQKIKSLERVSIDLELKNLIHTLAHPHHKTNRIAIPVLNGYKMISVQDILYCEASHTYTNIYCTGQSVICSSINLGEYEELLEEYSFSRVHHAYLVNRDHVKQYIKGEGGELVIDKDIVIPVSRRKKQDVIEWLQAGR